MISEEPAQPVFLRRADALLDGISDAELARAVRRSELVRIQRGTYAETPATTSDDAAVRHALVVAATVAGLRVPGVVSHASAAVLHRLPLCRVPLGRVHVLRPPPAGGSGSARVHLHVARVPDDHVILVDGLLATDVTRTVVDVARTVPFESAVVLADRAVRTGGTSRERLSRCLERMGAVPGSRQAARVIAFADPLSESVGESRSRVLLHRLGLPAPDLQVRELRRDSSVFGGCDFGWEDDRTLAEFDGRITYGRLLKPGQDAGDAVFEEKRREDELRDHRWEVARWTWQDIDRPRVVEGESVERSLAVAGDRNSCGLPFTVAVMQHRRSSRKTARATRGVSAGGPPASR
ncbi:type IV toxin-antitoxin system AbiEi family antitoxin domain-containing protein [Blastococcus brunescens]|uniref:Type IV toxin-antitoxin system AbiEi family antitoxin domain-containing protein n=1 Tax=Blastococcus brunescens TaxID=1564165 RepID=A0ABZ1B1S9_9ACTN|nr:type IV toxin-antitoxin system AbiEi family antitoxin domain-containing protein [Blastococcus sp. BMG 8361]WRL64766.1 type IV toxin-antitoxin system AbiEi family antitoxin domain-containing protein [Blastococcus sp. BMG 8361]